MTRPFRHAVHLEREYRGRLLRRVRAIATRHHEATRTDETPRLAPVVGLLALARQIGRFIGRQVTAMIAALAARGAPVRVPTGRTLPAMGQSAPVVLAPEPSPTEMAAYSTWAAAETAAIEAMEARLVAELPVRPDALARAETRARGIAREGVGWLTGMVQEVRAVDAGVTGYFWRGMLDDIERDAHLELEGQFVRWDEPPIAEANGDRYHAGQTHIAGAGASFLWTPTRSNRGSPPSDQAAFPPPDGEPAAYGYEPRGAAGVRGGASVWRVRPVRRHHTPGRRAPCRP